MCCILIFTLPSNFLGSVRTHIQLVMTRLCANCHALKPHVHLPGDLGGYAWKANSFHRYAKYWHDILWVCGDLHIVAHFKNSNFVLFRYKFTHFCCGVNCHQYFGIIFWPKLYLSSHYFCAGVSRKLPMVKWLWSFSHAYSFIGCMPTNQLTVCNFC